MCLMRQGGGGGAAIHLSQKHWNWNVCHCKVLSHHELSKSFEQNDISINSFYCFYVFIQGACSSSAKCVMSVSLLSCSFTSLIALCQSSGPNCLYLWYKSTKKYIQPLTYYCLLRIDGCIYIHMAKVQQVCSLAQVTGCVIFVAYVGFLDVLYTNPDWKGLCTDSVDN